MKKIYVAVLICVIFAAIVAVGTRPYASASDDADPIVEIWDSTFTNETDYFTTCPVTVGIKTYSSIGPYNVILVKPDGTNFTLATGVTAGVWHNFTYTCDQTGYWQAEAGSATIPFAIGTFLVIPQVPLGAITALAACFTGFGVKQIQGRRKQTL